MHTYCVVKVKAEDADGAHSIVADLMDETCGDGYAFDYVSEVKTITEEMRNTELKKTSWEDIEKHYQNFTSENIESNKVRIKEEIERMLSIELMSAEDAPLYVNSKNNPVKDRAKEVLEKNINKDLPKNLTEIVDAVSSAIIRDTTKFSMLNYYLKRLEELNIAIKYPEDKYSCAKCPDVHYIDITHEGAEEDSVFYVFVDRHY